MTLWIDNLTRLVALVDQKLSEVKEAAGTYDTKSFKDYSHWRARHDGAMRRVMAFFTSQENASFTSRGSDSTVKMAGIRSTCTSGWDGALHNWKAAAQKKIDAQHAVDDGFNPHGSGPVPIEAREG